MMYKCDICGRYLYLDAGECRICDDCQADEEIRDRIARRMVDGLLQGEAGQYEMNIEGAYKYGNY